MKRGRNEVRWSEFCYLRANAFRSLSSSLRFLLSGISFAILWASASVAGKFGLQSAEPLTLFTIRFLMAGGVLLNELNYFQEVIYELVGKPAEPGHWVIVSEPVLGAVALARELARG